MRMSNSSLVTAIFCRHNSKENHRSLPLWLRSNRTLLWANSFCRAALIGGIENRSGGAALEQQDGSGDPRQQLMAFLPIGQDRAEQASGPFAIVSLNHTAPTVIAEHAPGGGRRRSDPENLNENPMVVADLDDGIVIVRVLHRRFRLFCEPNLNASPGCFSGAAENFVCRR